MNFLKETFYFHKKKYFAKVSYEKDDQSSLEIYYVLSMCVIPNKHYWEEEIRYLKIALISPKTKYLKKIEELYLLARDARGRELHIFNFVAESATFAFKPGINRSMALLWRYRKGD